MMVSLSPDVIPELARRTGGCRDRDWGMTKMNNEEQRAGGGGWSTVGKFGWTSFLNGPFSLDFLDPPNLEIRPILSFVRSFLLSLSAFLGTLLWSSDIRHWDFV